MERTIHAALAVVACLIALALAGLFALTLYQIALKASDELRSYRADGPRMAAAGDAKSVFHSGGFTK